MRNVKRKTEFWKETTPSKVGPGTYEQHQDHAAKENPAAFSQSQKRTLSEPRPGTATLPAPNSYVVPTALGKHARCGSDYAVSRSPRMLPFAPGVTGFVLPSNYNNPGPGSYEVLSVLAKPMSASSKTRHSSLVVEPSPASIPNKPANPPTIGPTYYTPNDTRTRRNSQSTAFAAYKTTRAVFPPVHEGEPGPGEYEVEVLAENRTTWVFSSESQRPVNVKLAKTDQPGPGTYDLEKDAERPSVTVEGFGSTTRKNIKKSDDPHRPYVVGSFSVPPVGTYKTKEQLTKTEQLKQKFVSFEVPVQKAPFGSSEKKVGPWTTNSYPGPGDYQTERTKTSPSKPQGAKAPRFKYKSSETLPGPGHYEAPKPERKRRNSVQFSSKTPRFTALANRNPNVLVVGKNASLVPYVGHEDWAKEQRYVVVAGVQPSFNSGSVRVLQQGKKNTPGPGSYDVRPRTVPSVPKVTSSRFESYGGYNLKIGTTKEVGPGKYHKTPSMAHKSFNMLGESVSEKPWI